MKKTLLIVAMLLLVTPVMATTTIKVLVTPADQFTGPDGNKVQPVRIAYVTDVNVRAFALDINIRDINGSPNFQHIREFKVGESNGAANPPGTFGYGIFPSRFRDFVNPLTPDACYASPNYNPTTAWNEPETTDHNSGMGYPKMIVEMGTLYAGDLNRPALSGTLFKFDVNSYGVSGTFRVNVKANALRGGVVNSDGNTITAAYEANDVCFAPPVCILPNVVSQPEATATDAITAAGFALGTRTTACSDVVGIIAGDIISTNPVAGSYTCGISVDYVVSTGPCCVIVPNVVNTPEASATATITNAGLTLGTRTTAHHDTIVAGNIISTNPANPTCVPLGTPVAYVVSLGPCTLPNIVGMTKANAEAAITSNGFTVGTETGVFSDTTPVNQVTVQNPAPGVRPCGTAVTLSYVCRTVTCRNPRCVGDVDADTWVRGTDITALVTLIGTYPSPSYRMRNTDCRYDACADVDNDTWVRGTDVTALVTKIGTYPSPSYRCRCGGAACPYTP